MLGELAALFAAICWAISPVLYKIALRDVKPIPANISRCLSTMTLLLLFSVFSGAFQNFGSFQAEFIQLAILSGIFGRFLGDTMLLVSLDLLGVSRAVPIHSSLPLFTTFFGVLFLGDAVTLFLVLGTVAIVTGTLLVSQESESMNIPKKLLLKGVISALVTAVFWAVSVTLMDHALEISQKDFLESSFLAVVIGVTVSTLLFLSLSPIVDRRLSFIKLKRRTWIIIAAGGVLALGLGWFLLAVSLSQIEVSRAVPLTSVCPLFATLIGVFLLKEKITLKIAVGITLIILGAAIVIIA